MKRLAWLLFGALLLYFIFLVRQDIIDGLGQRKEFDRAGQALRQEEDRTQRLNDRLRQAQSADQLEELARTRLGLIKKGETAYKVIDD